MKIGKFLYEGEAKVGVAIGDKWIEGEVFADIVENADDIVSYMSLSDAQKKRIDKRARKMKDGDKRVHRLADAQYMAPVGEYSNLYTMRGLSTIFSRAVRLKMPTQPTFDIRYTHNFVGHEHVTVLEKGQEVGGWNIELVAVIGKEAKNVDRKDVYDYVGGYTILSDTSGHDECSPFYGDGPWRMEDDDMEIVDHFYRTNFNGNSLLPVPIGPYITTSEEVGDPHKLMARESEKGRLVAHSSTEGLLMFFDEIIAFISTFITLKPGDMVSSSSISYDGYKHWESHDKDFYIDLEIEKVGKLRMLIDDRRGAQYEI